jgi:hypothetical protein
MVDDKECGEDLLGNDIPKMKMVIETTKMMVGIQPTVPT